MPESLSPSERREIGRRIVAENQDGLNRLAAHDALPFWSFTIVVTDNDTGVAYDYTITVDRAIPPGKLYLAFVEALKNAALFHSQSGICPGRELP